MIIYLHGLNSSPLSSKGVALTDYCVQRSIGCVAPQLHHRPGLAVEQIEKLLETDGEHVLVGSSMGGYYATWFCEKTPQARAVLINPAVRLADKLEGHVGEEQENYHTGERYVFEAAHLEEFRALQVEKIACPEKYLLLAQKGDELLDWREAGNLYAGAEQIIEDGGDHSFVGFHRYLGRIIEFSKKATEK